jgi:hypothetical protein
VVSGGLGRPPRKGERVPTRPPDAANRAALPGPLVRPSQSAARGPGVAVQSTAEPGLCQTPYFAMVHSGRPRGQQGGEPAGCGVAEGERGARRFARPSLGRRRAGTNPEVPEVPGCARRECESESGSGLPACLLPCSVTCPPGPVLRCRTRAASGPVCCISISNSNSTRPNLPT